MEALWRFSYVTTGAKHYQKKVDKNATQLKFKANNNKEYKVKNIWDSTIYKNKSETGSSFRVLLPGIPKKLLIERKYLETSFYHLIP